MFLSSWLLDPGPATMVTLLTRVAVDLISSGEPPIIAQFLGLVTERVSWSPNILHVSTCELGCRFRVSISWLGIDWFKFGVFHGRV